MTVGKTVASRALGFPIGFACSLVGAHLLIGSYGLSTYALYSLINSLLLLLPVTDLGLGAVVMNALGNSAPEGPSPRRILVTAYRVAGVASLTVIAVGALLSLSHAWPVLLGRVSSSRTVNFAAGGTLAVFGVSVFTNIGIRGLNAVGRNSVVAVIQSLSPAAVLLALYLCVHSHAPPYVLPIAPTLAAAVVGLLCTIFFARHIGVSFRVAGRRLVSIRTFPGTRIRSTSSSMLMIQFSGPVSIQSDRIIISHSPSSASLAQYSLHAQVLFPLLVLVSSAGTTLWSMYVRAGRDSRSRSVAVRSSLFFGIVASAFVGLFCLVGRLSIRTISDHSSSFSVPIALALGGYCIVQAFWTPLAMFMTDARGLQFQARCSILMAICNIGLSVSLVRVMGAAGPALASALAVGAIVVVPGIVRFKRLPYGR